MADTKFTPGPWRIGPIHKDKTFAIHAKESSVIHCTPFSGAMANAEANAHLIAAAPEMYGALKEALARLTHQHECVSIRPTAEWEEHGSISLENCKCLISRVRAALAKAEGVPRG